jgi:hypothetical protein
MRRSIVATLLLSLGASAGWADHPGSDIDARFATPGLRLEAIELHSVGASSSKRYRLRAEGFPEGVIFRVYTRHFEHAFEEAASGFKVDRATGDLVANEGGRPQRLGQMVLEPGPYPRGAIWEIALVSADRRLSAYAKVVPYPIVARDGDCVLTLELVSRRGLRFLASGTGFPPGDEVTTESIYAGRSVQQRRHVSSEGRLEAQVISHASTDADRSARYGVRSRRCAVAIDYEWGEAALVSR